MTYDLRVTKEMSMCVTIDDGTMSVSDLERHLENALGRSNKIEFELGEVDMTQPDEDCYAESDVEFRITYETQVVDERNGYNPTAIEPDTYDESFTVGASEIQTFMNNYFEANGIPISVCVFEESRSDEKISYCEW